MSVQKMTMMNIVGHKDVLEETIEKVILMGNVHIVNALNEINDSNFTLNIEEKNIDEIVGMCMIRPLEYNDKYSNITKKVNRIREVLDLKEKVKQEYLNKYFLDNNIDEINNIYEKVNDYINKIELMNNQLLKISEYERNFVKIKDLNIDLDKLKRLHYFSYSVGVLSKENRIKLKNNYENISAIVLHTGSSINGEVYLIISPKDLEMETERILKSLNFNIINIPDQYRGIPKKLVFQIEKEKEDLQHSINLLKQKLAHIKENYYQKINSWYAQLKLSREIEKVKEQIAVTNNFFYLSGWIPAKDKRIVRNEFNNFGSRVILNFKEEYQVNKYIVTPTKLNNNKLFKPFEYLVKIYGIPSYKEIDPTLFLGITYMILFGAMFGDLGQGFILFLIGLYLTYTNKQKNVGLIINRLGLSSMFFGVLYGSVFGFENIISELLFRPLDNINLTLMCSIVIGIFLIFISYIYGIINRIKLRNYKEALLGKYGLTGLLFYIMTLFYIGEKLFNITILPGKYIISILIGTMIIILIKEPLSSIILNNRVGHKINMSSSYIIESGFQVFEILLSMFSGTLSFIRIGAFALNHVGLFIAFHTMARLITSYAGSIIILVIGNIIIIGLEGLIVSIQGLRLEYYELFSKYYKGTGVEFMPVKLDIN